MKNHMADGYAQGNRMNRTFQYANIAVPALIRIADYGFRACVCSAPVDFEWAQFYAFSAVDTGVVMYDWRHGILTFSVEAN